MARFLFYDDRIVDIFKSTESPSGGAAVQAFAWIHGLTRSGQDIYILTRAAQPSSIKKEYQHYKLLPLYDETKGIRWLRWVYYRLPYVFRSIKAVKPDYLYQGVPGWPTFLIGIICRYLRIKFIVRISNDYLLDERFLRNYSRLHYYLVGLGLKSAYCILCQNSYQYGLVKSRYPAKPVLKVPNPILTEPMASGVSAKERSFIAWVGLFQYQKNLPLLYHIASLLKQEEFYIAGKALANIDEETHLHLEKLKQLPNVKFAGFLDRNQILPFLAQAKFLLNTSHYEGFSNTFLEAMKVGTPILTTDKVNPDNIISAHNLGIVYNDPHDLNAKVNALSPAAYASMSGNSQEYVLKNHDCEMLAYRLLDFLNVATKREPA